MNLTLRRKPEERREPSFTTSEVAKELGFDNAAQVRSAVARGCFPKPDFQTGIRGQSYWKRSVIMKLKAEQMAKAAA